mmetsp:Transcript_3905/g.13825  ORF Transcript_3905/g.13825 Transcript_3905/m.13825 type:complete len:280 (-) Transcript_3905:1536-2375(-)
MDEAHRYEPMAQVEPSSVLQERPPEWSHQIRQPEGGLLFRVLNVTILMLSLLVCTLGFTWPLFWVGWTAGVFGLMGAVLNLHMLSSMEVGAAPQRRGAATWLTAAALVSFLCFWTSVLVGVGLFMMATVCEDPVEYAKQYAKDSKLCAEYDPDFMHTKGIYFFIEGAFQLLLAMASAAGIQRTCRIFRNYDLEQAFGSNPIEPPRLCPFARALVVEEMPAMNEQGPTPPNATLLSSKEVVETSSLVATTSTRPEQSKAKAEEEAEQKQQARKDKEPMHY